MKESASQSKLKRKVIEQWDKNAPWWSRFIGKKGDAARREIILPAVVNLLRNFAKPRRMLDAGCGEGYFSRMICDSNMEVVGVDISSQQILNAMRKTPLSLKAQITFLQDDLEFMEKVKNTKFDFIVCANVLMDTPDAHRVLKNLAGRLLSNGLLIAVIIHPDVFGPSGPCLHLLDARILRSYREGVCYSVRLDPAAPHRTLYFYRPVSYYLRAVPPSIRIITNQDLFAHPKTSPRMFKAFGSNPIFKLLAWRKVHEVQH